MKADVIILFEHKNRELESDLLLAKKLEQRGFSVRLLQLGWDADPMSAFIRTSVLVTPWCYDDRNFKRLGYYKGSLPGRSFAIVNTHCEQVTSKDATEFVVPSGKAKEMYHFAWGQCFKEMLIDAGVEEGCICVTGSPRLDFFRPDYSSICASKRELADKFHLDMTKKWILLIGNFSAAFFSDDRIFQLEKRSIPSARENRDLSRASMEEIFSWYETMAACYKDEAVEFIYRPHPSEPVSGLAKSLEKKHLNVHVIKELAIRDWLVNCGAAFMWNSTSSVEAVYAGVPVYALRPKEIPEHLKFNLLEHLTQLRSEEQLVEAVSDVLNGDSGEVNTEIVEVLEYYYHKGSISAADLSADYIEKIISDPQYTVQTTRPFLYGFLKSIAASAKLILKKIGLLEKIPGLEKVSDDYISRAELNEIRRKIDLLSSET